MLFNSLAFLIFLIIVLFFYYLMPHKFRWVLLLISSYYFYMCWRVEFIFLIIFSSIINYYLAIKIYNFKDNKNKKITLILGLLINFLILFLFKYFLFIVETFNIIFNYFKIDYSIKKFDIILPMGISFYTFQAVSYIIDIYRNRYKPEKNFFKLSLYITFFPQLVAGPIERADNLLSQLFTKKDFLLENLLSGFKIMILGYFKKVVIADRAAILVNTVYNSPTDYTGISFIISTIFFAIQIYCDFSGYSDIAIGCAKLFGIDLMQNFKSPYFSKSIKEFWQRWHISLSTWFKDYLYIPLGGNRCSIFRNYFNLFITFIISGLWHGANWTFVFWGAIHGIYQIIGDIKNRFILKNKKIQFKNKFLNYILNLIKTIYIFLIICFAWIFFRANSINDGIYIVKNLFNDINYLFNMQYMYNIINSLGLGFFEIFIVILCVIILLLIEMFEKENRINYILDKSNFLFRLLFYYFIILIILSLGVFSNAGEFIYFQF